MPGRFHRRCASVVVQRQARRERQRLRINRAEVHHLIRPALFAKAEDGLAIVAGQRENSVGGNEHFAGIQSTR